MNTHSRPRGVIALVLASLALPLVAQQLPEDLEVRIDRRFDAQDADDDGKLTPEEVFAFTRTKAPEGNEGVLRQIAMAIRWEFVRIDTDRDEALTREEVVADALARKAHRETLAPEDAGLFEGRFSQCSYNALASVLIHFHGPTPEFKDRKEMEQRTFRAPLKSEGFGGYHGWAPWTGYMVNSKQIPWNGIVTDLKAENFSLRPKELPAADPKGRRITVTYAPGEREELEAELLARLEEGPVVIWTPYAAVLSPIKERWKHVEHRDAETDVVPFGSFTHAVAVFRRPDGRIMVVDGATRDGVYESDLRTVVATSSAMASFIRIRPTKDRKTIFERSRGIEEERYNVVFSRKEGS